MVLTETDITGLEQAVLDLDETYFQGEPKDSLAWLFGSLLASGKFLDVLFHEKSPLGNILTQIKAEIGDKKTEAHEIILNLRDRIEDFLTVGPATPEKHLSLLFSAVAALMVFVQSNWTGPGLENADPTPIHGVSESDALAELVMDGESVYKKAPLAQYLLLARQVMLDNASYVKHSKSITWWAARYGFKLQAVLSGPSETLRNFINSQFNKSMFAYASRPEILLEFGLVYHHYKNSQNAREYLLKAKAAAKLYSELSGMMGRRTKYQTFDTPQLVLLAQSYKSGRDMPSESSEVVLTPSHYVDKDSLEAFLGPVSNSEDSESPSSSAASSSSNKSSSTHVTSTSSSSTTPSDTPTAVAIAEDKKSALPSQIIPDDDDIRLSAPKLVDDSKADLTDENLKVSDQCILLGLCLDVRNENPRHGLTYEQMKAYVERVMKHPNNWMVHSMALLIKSRLETNTTKYIDRAAMQLQVLADQFKEADTAKEYPAIVRCRRIFQVLYPPMHRLKAEIGELYLKLGVARSALAIFEELEMWSDAVAALQICGEDERARGLIQSRFEEDGSQSPELLCLMGDVSVSREEKIAYYTKCWEVSRGKYPRSKRQLAKLAMEANDFKLAILHYKDALAVNPQYGFAWFRMGCCALELQDWDAAQLAFTRVTFLHPDDSEAWSNLAASCLKLGKLKEAHSAFKEALKHNQENWRIWDNYMVSCVKLGFVQEAIFCLHKLLELNTSADVEILDILVNIATTKFSLTDPQPHQATESHYVHKQLRTLLGRISTQISNNPDLWAVYAKYHNAIGDFPKVVEYRQKQCRALQTVGSESEPEKFEKLVKGLQALTEALELANDKSASYSTKLNVKSLLKKAQESFETTQNYKDLEAIVPRLEAIQ